MGDIEQKWLETIGNFELFIHSPNGEELLPLLAFIRELAASPLAKQLRPSQSHEMFVVRDIKTDPHQFPSPAVCAYLVPSTGRYQVTFSDDRVHYCSERALREVFMEGVRRHLGGERIELSNGWRRLDGQVYWHETEEEWLKRPFVWINSWLPQEQASRKEWLHSCIVYRRRLVEIGCRCANHLLKAIDWRAENWPVLTQVDTKETCATTPVCPAAEVLRAWEKFAKGIITLQELKNRMYERLYEKTPDPALYHDIYGNPFQPICFDEAWRTEGVLTAARAAYDCDGIVEPERIQSLVRALQEAGCNEARITGHLRGRQHYRGCAVLDLVLAPGIVAGKK